MTDDPTTPPQPIILRDNAGKFLPGSKAGLGHKTPQHVLSHQFRKVFSETVGTAKFKEVINRHIELILTASPKEAAPLIDLLYSYVLGKPQQNIALDVNSTHAPTLPTDLDAQDIQALERIRNKMGTGRVEIEDNVIDAEVIPSPEVSS